MQIVRLAIIAASGTAFLAGCGESVPRIAAKVERIERRCEYTETSYRDYGGGKRTKTGSRERYYDCSDDPKFLAIQSGRTPDVRINGTATIIARYTSPADKKDHTAWIKIESGDREFYSVKAGQEIQIALDPQDSSKASL